MTDHKPRDPIFGAHVTHQDKADLLALGQRLDPAAPARAAQQALIEHARATGLLPASPGGDISFG